MFFGGLLVCFDLGLVGFCDGFEKTGCLEA